MKKMLRFIKRKMMRQNYTTRKLALWLTNTWMHIKFRMMCIKYPTDEKTIMFNAFNGKQWADSPKAIYEYMLRDERFADFKFIWTFRREKLEEIRDQFTDPRTTLVLYRSRDFYEAHARAKYLVTNWRMLPFLIKKRNQVLIETWHGTPLKKIGLDSTIEGNPLTSQKESHKHYFDDAKRYDYFVSPSAFCTRVFATAFGLDQLHKENILIETGYPRNDFLISHLPEDEVRIKKELGIPLDKKIILYAPTWRDNQHALGVGNTLDVDSTFSKFMREISDDYVVLLRLHYLIASQVDVTEYGGRVFDFSKLDDVNLLYVISDILITDYSSVFFDYANLNRPILFYMYDLEEYRTQIRDFYIDLEELPGPIVMTQEALLNAVYRTDDIAEEYRERYRTFCDTYNYLDDGMASKRVVDICIK